MRGARIPDEPALVRYQEHQRVEAEAAWARHLETDSARAAVAFWLQEEAARHASEGAADESAGRLGLRLERVLMLAGLPEAARRFAPLARGADDDPAALWMLGLAAADAVVQRPDRPTWHVVRDVLTSLAWDAFEAELVERLKGDSQVAGRFLELAATIVEAENGDPAAGVLTGERGLFMAAIAEWRETRNLASLRRGLPGTDLYSGPSSEILLVVHQFSRESFVNLLSRFDLPHPVQEALASRRIVHDLSEIVELLRLAPPAFDAQGAWNGSQIAPILLETGLEHLRARQRWPDNEANSADLSDEDLATDLSWAASELVRAALDRSDALPLGFNHSTGLVRDLAWRMSQNGNPPPPQGSDAGAAPGWFLLNALVQHPSARSWAGWRPPDMAGDDRFFATVTSVLPAVSAKDRSGIADEDLPVPATLDDAVDIEAVGTAMALAPRPSDWIHQTLGWIVAGLPDPAGSWSERWRSTSLFRERDLHRIGQRLDTHSEAVSKALWAIGLGALDWLPASDSATIPAREALCARLYNAALERWLSSAFIDDFWSSAVIHVVVRWARIHHPVTGANGQMPPERSAQANSFLAQIIGPFIGPDEHFLRMLRSLQTNGIPAQAIGDALGPGSSLDNLAEIVRALGALDRRFAASTSRLLSDVEDYQRAEPNSSSEVRSTG